MSYNILFHHSATVSLSGLGLGLISIRDVNIEFFPNPDIECDNPVKIRISDFIRAA